MHYVIFLPGRRGASPANLQAVGLGGLIEGAQFVESLAIPEFKGGSLVFWGEVIPPADLREWKWEPAKENESAGLAGDRFRIGWDIAAPPTPTDLARPRQFAGHWHTLNDGNEWLIPSYRRLDHVYQLGDNGQPVRRPSPEWEAFCRRSEEIQRGLFELVNLAHLLNGQGMVPDNPDTEIKSCSIQDGIVHASEALAINYRTNLEIVLLFNLFTDLNLPGALSKTIDLPEIIATHDEKKNYNTVEIPVI